MDHVIAFSADRCFDPRCAARADQLATALDHRDTIGMAKGLLMAARNCTPDEAFETMRAESSHTNTKLWQIAERIVRAHAARSAVPPLV